MERLLAEDVTTKDALFEAVFRRARHKSASTAMHPKLRLSVMLRNSSASSMNSAGDSSGSMRKSTRNSCSIASRIGTVAASPWRGRLGLSPPKKQTYYDRASHSSRYSRGTREESPRADFKSRATSTVFEAEDEEEPDTGQERIAPSSAPLRSEPNL